MVLTIGPAPARKMEIVFSKDPFPGIITCFILANLTLTPDMMVVILANIFEDRRAEIISSASLETEVLYIPSSEIGPVLPRDGQTMAMCTLLLMSNYFTKNLSEAATTFASRLKALLGVLAIDMSEVYQTKIVSFLSENGQAIAKFCQKRSAFVKCYFACLKNTNGTTFVKGVEHVIRLSMSARVAALISVAKELYYTGCPIIAFSTYKLEVQRFMIGLNHYVRGVASDPLFSLTLSDEERVNLHMTQSSWPTLAAVATELRAGRDPGFVNYRRRNVNAVKDLGSLVQLQRRFLDKSPLLNKEVMESLGLSADEYLLAVKELDAPDPETSAGRSTPW